MTGRFFLAVLATWMSVSAGDGRRLTVRRACLIERRRGSEADIGAHGPLGYSSDPMKRRKT